MKARILIIVLLLISVINLAACISIYNPTSDTNDSSTSSTTPTTPTTPTIPTIPTIPIVQLVQFEDRTWVLEKYGKTNNLQNVISGKEANAKFDSSSGKVSGAAGCNSYAATYQRTINKVAVTGMSTTMMSCPIPAGIMQQENAFKDALIGAESCRIVNNKLEINCTLDRILVFHPK